MNVIISLYRSLIDKKIRFNYLSNIGLYNDLEDRQYLEKKFKIEMGYKLDLECPVTFNEKLQWLKLYNRHPEYTTMVDKYAVREYISNTIGEEYLIPLLGVWDDPKKINFDKLPQKFVLKCNHNSGLGMTICENKDKLSIKKTVYNLERGLKQDYYLTGREWPYKDVKRKIICEKFMEDSSEDSGLADYKVMCFDGIPKLIEVHRNRFTKNHTQDFYTSNWEKLDIAQIGETNSSQTMEKPKNLSLMLQLSKRLARNIPHVRVDWYEIEEQIYFGELTFFDGSGFVPFCNFKDDIMLGSWITLIK